MFGISSPGATWSDTACGAWLTGGETIFTAGDYAGIGFTLNNTSTYSLVGYTGLSVQYESGHPVVLILKDLNGNEFYSNLPATTGAPTANVPFKSFTPDTAAGTLSGANLDLTSVTDIQFAASDPTAFGYAIHLVALY
jgi:hypothetical protein